MAMSYKILGQASTTNAYTSLYTVPAGTSAVISTLSICSIGVEDIFRVAVIKVGEETVDDDSGAVRPSSHQYLVYDAPIAKGESIFMTLGLTLAEGDSVCVFSGTPYVTFNLFGSEIA